MKTNSIKNLLAAACALGLLQLNTANAADQYWDPGLTAAASGASGGTGSWNSTTTNWANQAAAGGSDAVWGSGNNAFLGGTAGTVSLGAETLTVGTLTLNTAGYTIDKLGTNLTVASLAGTGSFTEKGNGTFTISGSSSGFSGAIYLGRNANSSGDIILIGANDSLGTGQLYARGAYLQTAANGLVVANNFDVGSAAGGLRFSGTNDLTLSGTIVINNGSYAIGSTTTAPLNITGTIDVNSGTLAEASFQGSGLFNVTGTIVGQGTVGGSHTTTTMLSGTNTYTGATTIRTGVLMVGVTGGSCSNSAVTVQNGAKLGVKLNSVGGEWTCGSVTLNSGVTTLQVDYNNTAPSTSAAPLQVVNTVVNSGTLNLTVLNGSFALGDYPLIKASSVTAGTLGTVVLPGGAMGNLTSDSTTIYLHVTTATPALQYYWGGGNGVWDIGTTANWNNDGSGSKVVNYANTYPAVFDDTASGTGPFTVTLNTTVNPGLVTVNATTNGYTISGSGAISGATSLVKSGTNALTLSGANTYTGNTTISAGTLVLANQNAIQNSTLNGGTPVFDSSVSGHAFNVGGLAGNSGLALQDNGVSSNAIALTVGGNNASSSYSGVISAAGSLTKVGSGTLTLAAANTFTGNITINAGIVEAAAGGSLGAKDVSGRIITVNSGATLSLAVNNIFGGGPQLLANTPTLAVNGGTVSATRFNVVGDVTLAAGTLDAPSSTGVNAAYQSYEFNGSTVTVNGTAKSTISNSGLNTAMHLAGNKITTFNVNATGDASGDDLLVSAVLRNGSGDRGGVGGLTKTGPGTMNMSGASIYTGATIVSNGTLLVSGSLGDTAVTVNGGKLTGNGTIGTVAASVTIDSGGTLMPGTNGAPYYSPLYINGTLTMNSGSTNAFSIDVANHTSTQVSSLTDVTYGGTLKVTAIGDPSSLVGGDTFYLFSSSAYHGAFANVDLPALSGELFWDTSGLFSSGSIRVSAGVPTPIFLPQAGGYASPQSVTIQCGDAGATILYSTDAGATYNVYTVPIALPSDTTSYSLQAYATNIGYADSQTKYATYSTTPVPTWENPNGGSWADNVGNSWSNNVVANASGVTADFSTLTLTYDNDYVALDGARTVGNLLFADRGNAYGWWIEGGSSALTLDSASGISTINCSNMTTTINAVVAGTNSVVKTGAGALTLTKRNTFTGDVTINEGTVTAMSTGGNNTAGPLGANNASGRIITVNSGTTLSLAINNILGGGSQLVANTATLAINGGTVSATRFNVLGDVTLAAATLDAPSSAGANASYQSYEFNGSTVTVNGTAKSTISNSGANSAMHLAGGKSTTFNVNATGDASGDDLLVSAVLIDGSGDRSGAGGLTKTGPGTMKMSGASIYTGGTVVSNGTLRVTGSLASGSAVTVEGGTLGGNGTIGGSVTVNSGELSPGASIDTLTVSGSLNLNAGSTSTFEVNGSTPTNDVVALGGAATYGGTLNIVPSGTFTNGQTFTLFSGASVASASNFASITGSPGSGLAFSFTNGVLSVVNATVSSATLTNSVSGGVLSLSWPAGQGWRLEWQTNTLSIGLGTNWLPLTDGSVSSTNITIDPTKPTVFYRLVNP